MPKYEPPPISDRVKGLSKQFEGKTFGKFVLSQMKKMPPKNIAAAMQEIINTLPDQAKDEFKESMNFDDPPDTDFDKEFSFDKEFWTENCKEAFMFFSSMNEDRFNEKYGIQFSEKNLLDLFNFWALFFAYHAHYDKKKKKFIKNSIRNQKIINKMEKSKVGYYILDKLDDFGWIEL